MVKIDPAAFDSVFEENQKIELDENAAWSTFMYWASFNPNLKKKLEGVSHHDISQLPEMSVLYTLLRHYIRVSNR